MLVRDLTYDAETPSRAYFNSSVVQFLSVVVQTWVPRVLHLLDVLARSHPILPKLFDRSHAPRPVSYDSLAGPSKTSRQSLENYTQHRSSDSRENSLAYAERVNLICIIAGASSLPSSCSRIALTVQSAMLLITFPPGLHGYVTQTVAWVTMCAAQSVCGTFRRVDQAHHSEGGIFTEEWDAMLISSADHAEPQSRCTGVSLRQALTSMFAAATTHANYAEHPQPSASCPSCGRGPAVTSSDGRPAVRHCIPGLAHCGHSAS